MYPSKKLEQSSGAVMVLFSFFLAALIGIAAIVVDIGSAYVQDRRIQYGSDAAALAGVEAIANGAWEFAAEEAEIIALANGITSGELAGGTGIELGIWNPETAGFVVLDETAYSNANAVRVGARRHAQTFFGRFFYTYNIPVARLGIAALPIEQSSACLKPFGLQGSDLPQPWDIDWGVTTFPIGNNSPGNWGKLNLGGNNMSSGPAFIEAMLNGTCDLVFVGDETEPVLVPVATGFAGVKDAFNNLFNHEDESKRKMVLAVVSDFPSGASQPVTIQSFLEVELVALTVGGGQNWTGTLKLISETTNLSDINEETVGPRKIVL